MLEKKKQTCNPEVIFYSPVYSILWFYKEKLWKLLVSTNKKSKALMIWYTISQIVPLFPVDVYNTINILNTTQSPQSFPWERSDMKSHSCWWLLTSKIKPLYTFISWKGSLHVHTIFLSRNDMVFRYWI